MQPEQEFLCNLLVHVNQVKENLSQIRQMLEERGMQHDRSKFEAIEMDAFVANQAEFKKATYGTSAYRKCLEKVRPAIEHHHKNNRHHVQHHKNGFADMNFFDLLEMMADWKAAGSRDPVTSPFCKAIKVSFKEHNVPEYLQKQMTETAKALGWL